MLLIVIKTFERCPALLKACDGIPLLVSSITPEFMLLFQQIARRFLNGPSQSESPSASKLNPV